MDFQGEKTMKKQSGLLITSAVIIASIGCNAKPKKQEKVAVIPGKVLIAYYSWSGNTKAAAEQIQKVTGGTLFRIKPVKAYPTAYRACVNQAKKEIKSNFKPTLAGKVKDFDKYDVIFIGSPNWCGTMAPPVATFLTTYSLKGKTIVPFFTNGGGGMQRCETDVNKLCTQAGAILKAATFNGKSVKRSGKEVAKWAKSCVNLKKQDKVK